MDYMISREGQEYGPYTLADLQRYVASGEILLTDMARSEGMTDFLAVSQVIGTIPVPATLPHISLAPAANEYPDPPNLHWALVLLFSFLTCGLFDIAWAIVLAVWIKKLVPASRAIYYYGFYVACFVIIVVLSAVAAAQQSNNGIVGIFQLASVVVSLAARYSLRNALEQHYNSAEPMGLGLSGIMTFFFGAIYFQYHMNNIVRRKNLDRLSLSTF